MGGGDLNLKKSWHPHTMKNQEKVWKAEQAKEQEERRLDDLRKEIKEERDREELKRHGESTGVLHSNDNNAKLEWMYKSGNDLINREEYLLGRKVDKSFETLQVEEQRKETVGVKQPLNHVEHECVPFSIREYLNVQSTEQVDLQRKTMEDPLKLIKQREMEARRKLLENPVKLKEIHRILKTEKNLKTSKKTKKSKKAKKTKKKHKKHGSSDSETSTNDSDSDNDLDKELAKRVKLLKGDTGSDLSLSKLLDAKYKTISKELDKATQSKSRKHRRSYSSNDSGSENSVSSDAGRRNTNTKYKHETERTRDQKGNPRKNIREKRESNYADDSKRSNHRNQRAITPERKRDHNIDRQRSRSTDYKPSRRDHDSRYKREHESSRRRSRSRSPREDRRRNRRSSSKSPNCNRYEKTKSQHIKSRSPQNQNTMRQKEKNRARSPVTATPKSNVKKTLTDEERAARLREMVENATWRESDRTEVVTKHREAYAREEAQNQARDFDKNFINKEVKKAIANHSDIGTRIRANLNNIQRNSAAMNGNFARK